MNASEYLGRLPFVADRFQVEAAAVIDRGESVVVAAPTGSGKTVVAEAAVARALDRGLRALYTTPIKALSNQKYTDLREQHGAPSVGLLTGDNSINGSAPVVVMTTEVLRNMMYAGAPELAQVGVVVLDEVHYLQDPARGAVWEEIIIHLDRSIPLVCLSATIANGDEFRDWVAERRGPTGLVVETQRPVPLESTYLLRDRWEGQRLRLMDLLEGDLPNSALLRMLQRHPGRRRYAPPRRLEVAEMLRQRRLLPAIYFIFSRAGCSAAADAVVDRGLRLTTAEEAAHIEEVAVARTAHLDPTDLTVLGYGRWLTDLRAGVAPHHAGLVPAFKETAEELFAQGIVRLVFATETLALGINMPARTVVLENLSKFTGESHELLSAGDYTQLTGRAGRRGIDDQGTAVVLHSGLVPIERIAGIAAPGTHPLRSSFRPTYNMAVNLIAGYPRSRAEELLDASFARHHEARREAALRGTILESRQRLAELRAEADCDRVDVAALLDAGTSGSRRVMEAFAAACSAGDVIEWRQAGGARRHVVVARGRGKRPRLLLVSDDAELRRVAPEGLPESVAIVGRIDLPTPFRPREPRYRHRLAEQLRRWAPSQPPRRPHLTRPSEPGADCPDLERHLAAERAARRMERRMERDLRRLAGVSGGLVPRFRAIIDLLGSWGYVRGWSLTEAGDQLRFIFNELDLLLAEAVRNGLLDGLDAAETAAFVSVFTFEPRSDGESQVWPTAGTGERGEQLEALWERLSQAEAQAGLDETRPPHAGFAVTAYRWASGESLEDLFGEDAGGVGDFVRNCRQLLDLLRQLGEAEPRLRQVLDETIRAVDRGVVAAVRPT